MIKNRQSSQLDQIANQLVEKQLALSPLAATSAGIEASYTEMDDFSPEGIEAKSNLSVSALNEIAQLQTGLDEVDKVTKAAMQERLGLEIELDQALITHSSLNNLASPIQAVRSIFDLMPQESSEDWEIITARLHKIPAALTGYLESLKYAAANGVQAAKRQHEIGISQSENLASSEGFFAELNKSAANHLNPQQANELEAATLIARKAYQALAAGLDELCISAPEADAIGSEQYQLRSRSFLGEEIDLLEAYEYGIDQLQSLIKEQETTASLINQEYGNDGGNSISAAINSLQADPKFTLHGTKALQEWMQELSDQAIEALDGVHFDIPAPLKRLECMIAQTGQGGIYYTGPSEDLTRPGRMWWDTPKGVDTFQTWKETTTVYHEGVPGHHLQVGLQTLLAKDLNRWRSMGIWVSGHGEGWALYAERLMDELGFLKTNAERLGMLSEQRMRAARVVLDIGLHNGFEIPAWLGGGHWNYDRAWAFVKAHWDLPEPIARFELHRYLGWAGQAPSYKLGQRVWEQLRAQSASRNESLTSFHCRALELGALPLSVLKQALNDGYQED